MVGASIAKQTPHMISMTLTCAYDVYDANEDTQLCQRLLSFWTPLSGCGLFFFTNSPPFARLILIGQNYDCDDLILGYTPVIIDY